MRTTLDIDDDVLIAVREMAARERKRVGAVISRLLREELISSRVGPVGNSALGFRPFASRGVAIFDADVVRLRDADEG